MAKMAIKTLAQIILILIPVSNCAQTLITGRVVDSNTKEPVKGAIVTVSATNVQVKANYLGYFQVAADSGDVLTIEHAGYEPGQIKVPGVQGFQIAIKKELTPDYLGGMDRFYEALLKNLKYPSKARSRGTQGRIYISFDVDTLLGIQNINIISDIGDGCGQTIASLLAKTPNRWIPKSKVWTFIIPVTFQLGVPGAVNMSSLNLAPVGTDVLLPKGKLLEEIIVMAPPPR